jgi:gluconokinase
VDPSGEPVTPVYTWADTRAAGETRELQRTLDERAFHARTGARFHPLYLPAKLLWASRRLGGRGDVRWMSFGEYLYLTLFGRTAATVSMASGTGLLDVRRCVYDEEILGAVGVRPDQLSPLADLAAPFTGQTSVPELREVPWYPPVGDGACNNLGSGCATRERIGVMIGTSGAMRAAWAADRVEIPWGLWCYRADRRRVVMGGALSEGGNLVDWIRNTFRLPEAEEAERQVAAMAADAHGLTFLPFLAGERSPGWAADARATIHGLSLDTRPADVLRAGMEAVALRFAIIYAMLRQAVPEARQIVASGNGLLSSPAWMQILADALGAPITASAEPEASARGAALLVLEAQGAIPRVEDVPAALGRTYEPAAARQAVYARALERQRSYYEVLVKP